MSKSQKGKKDYPLKYPGRRRLSNKLAWLKVQYGDSAAEHFLRNASCVVCGESRFAALAVHHPEGKSVETFQTLCHNCHAVHHSGSWSLVDCSGMKVRGTIIP